MKYKTSFLLLSFTILFGINNVFSQDTDVQSTNTESLKTYSKFDFTPGEKIIYYDDFSQGSIGDFPLLWNTNGSGELITINTYPGRWFSMKPNGVYIPEIKGDFPDNFTIEYDVVPKMKDETTVGFTFIVYNASNPSDINEGGAIPGQSGIKINIYSNHADYSTYGEGMYYLNGSYDKELLTGNIKTRFSFWIQKQRIRVYANEIKIFDVIKAFPEQVKCNAVRFETWDDADAIIGDFRVATGLPDMRSKLMTEGKIVSYGIYFDSGKDIVKAESYPSLKDIAAILNENQTVRIKIVGHTDSDGDDAANIELSKKRALAVKNALVKDFAIAATRIDTDGKGESVPITPNTTSAGKAQNRRVEFIKL